VGRDDMGPVVEKLQEARRVPSAGAQILGVHLEGPYLNVGPVRARPAGLRRAACRDGSRARA
jgi:N-acetylglucosamine-6-phosphate deacetylase